MRLSALGRRLRFSPSGNAFRHHGQDLFSRKQIILFSWQNIFIQYFIPAKRNYTSLVQIVYYFHKAVWYYAVKCLLLCFRYGLVQSALFLEASARFFIFCPPAPVRPRFSISAALASAASRGRYQSSFRIFWCLFQNFRLQTAVLLPEIRAFYV